jgi:H+/gluconate symporter-like permease
MWLVVPIVLMTIPRLVGQAWNLSVLTVAIILFGGFAAFFMGPQPAPGTCSWRRQHMRPY